MKKLLFKSLMIMGAMLAAVTGFTSCSGGGDDEPTPTLSVSNPSLSIDGTGGSVTFQVTSNTKWVASSGASWCTVSPQSGEGNASVDVTASENTSTSSRKCTIRVRTTDGALSQDVTVEQSGAGASLSVTESLAFTSDKGNAKELDIKCNTEWQISGIPDWLDAPKHNGEGNATITFTTLSANNTATQRTATLTVTAGTETKQVSVTQAAGLAACTATPKNIVTLKQSAAMQIECSSDVKNYRMLFVPASKADTYTEEQMKEYLRASTSRTPSNRVIITDVDALSANTKYYQLTLAYDKNDNEGELIKTPFTTKGSTQQSKVGISDMNFYTNLTAKWTATPNEYTSKFYRMFLSGMTYSQIVSLCDDEGYFEYPLLAWIMQQEIKNNSSAIKTLAGVQAEITETNGYIIENNALKDNGNAVNYGYCLIVTLGENVSGGYSGDLDMEYTNVGGSESSPKKSSTSLSKRLGIKGKTNMPRAYEKY